MLQKIFVKKKKKRKFADSISALLDNKLKGLHMKRSNQMLEKNLYTMYSDGLEV